ncbi:MAG: hypothetical protein AAFO07_33380 [Bacteroidota bacterium]
MAQDNLEQFILLNREELDDQQPPAALWKNIAGQLEERSNRRFKVIFMAKRAAAILIILSVGAAAGLYFGGNMSSNALAANDNIPSEFFEVEAFYQQEFQSKYQQLVHYNVAPEIDDDLEQLESTMEELKKELLIAPDGKEDEILENLIQTYKTKVFILERILERIEINDHKNELENEGEISI